MKFFIVLTWAFIIAAIVFCEPKCKGKSNRKELIKCLEKSSDPLVIPTTKDQSGKERPVKVYHSLELTGILGNMESHTAVFNIIAYLYWEDENLAWRDGSNANIKYVVLPERLIWTPKLASYTPGAAESGDAIKAQSNTLPDVAVFSNGKVAQVIRFAFKEWCSKSPEDPLKVKCEIKLGSWFNDRLTLSLHKSPEYKTVLNSMKNDSVWYPINITWKITEAPYEEFYYPYSKLIFDIARKDDK